LSLFCDTRRTRQRIRETRRRILATCHV
jgi:hypothetical protein